MFRKLTLNGPLLKKATLCTKPRVQFDAKILTEIEENVYKARNHPGRALTKSKGLTLSDEMHETITKSLKDYPVKTLLKDSEFLSRYLTARHAPPENNSLQQKKQKIEEEVDTAMELKARSNMNPTLLAVKKKAEVDKIVKQRVYGWKPILYDAVKSRQYLLGRSAQEFAVLYRIFSEIMQRSPTFAPRSFLDFGSGCGTGTWAASKFWKKSIFEYFLVDSSREMNNLCDLILRGGDETKEHKLKNVFHRQFLPANTTQYDIVLSAYTLLECPSQMSRLELVQQLWTKTSRYLVLVEQGTRVGYHLIDECRDYILQTHGDEAKIFSPCPHDDACPRMLANDGTPCNFVVDYRPLRFGELLPLKKELFSYIVFEKNWKKHTKECEEERWPRIVRPTLVRSKHTVCRMCTTKGKLQEVIFTASKHGKYPYWCARSSKWGDRLPINIDTDTPNTIAKDDE